jgi:hypothetical protein
MHIAVIGAGLTGCITALGFADRGHRVTIFERASRLLSRASTANEGKIHLGYVFSADPSFHTAERLIDDALLFRPLVERWISAADFTASVCDPFVYAVPTTSALPPRMTGLSTSSSMPRGRTGGISTGVQAIHRSARDSRGTSSAWCCTMPRSISPMPFPRTSRRHQAPSETASTTRRTTVSMQAGIPWGCVSRRPPTS